MDTSELRERLLNIVTEIVGCVDTLMVDVTLPEKQSEDIRKLHHIAIHWRDLVASETDMKVFSQASTEIRTPITGMRGYSDFLLKNPDLYPDTLTSSQREQVQKIQNLAQNLYEVVETEIFHKKDN